MQLWQRILALALLPALFLQGGLRFGVCFCPAPHQTLRSCCQTQRARSCDEPGDEPAPQRWNCAHCYSISLPGELAKQPDRSGLGAGQPALHVPASWSPVSVSLARLERVSRTTGARAPSPPGERRSLPLLI